MRGHSYYLRDQTIWDLQCKPQQNGRGHTFGTLATVQPHSLGTGDKSPLVSEFCLEKYSSVLSSMTRLQGLLKSHHLQPRVTALSVPPPFLSAVHEKQINLFFKGAHGLLVGGGGTCTSGPPWVRHCLKQRIRSFNAQSYHS